MRYKKFLIMFLFVVLSMNFILIAPIKAEPTSDLVNLEELRAVMYDKMKTYISFSDNSFSGEFGLLYNFKNLSQSALWVDFANKDSSLKFTDGEKQHYNDYILGYIKRLNSYYGDSTNALKGVKLNNTGTKQLDNLDLETLIDLNIEPYLEDVLDNIQKQYNDAKDDKKKNEVLDSRKQSLRLIYEIATSYYDTLDDINNTIPRNVIDRNGNPAKAWEYKPSATGFKKLLNNDKYRSLLEKGREISEKEMQSFADATLGGTSEDRYVERLANKDGKFYKATFAMIASTAVYRPFESRVGDTDFTESLKNLVKDENMSDILEVYKQAVSHKKPLYKRDFDFLGKPQGSAKRISIDDFISDIEDGQSGALVLITKKMEKQADSNSYAYYDDSKNVITKTLKTGEGDVGDSSKSSTGNSSNTEANNSNTAKKDVPKDDAAVGLLAEDGPEITNEKIMSAPLFKYATHSPDKYANTGMLLLYNIIKDAKGISNIKNTKSRFLYINGLGDIVTDDDLVILPAAANPCFISDKFNYFPYTAAFMNSYPSSINSFKDTFKVVSNRDLKKYVLRYEVSKTDSESDKLAKDKAPRRDVYEATSYTISSNKDLKYFGASTLGLDTGMKDFGNGASTMFKTKTLKFDGFFENIKQVVKDGASSLVIDRPFLIKDNVGISGNGSSEIFNFPYTGTTDELPFAKMLAQNMYWSFTSDKEGTMGEANGRFDEGFFYKYVIPEVYNGLVNVSAYSKNYIQDYEAFVNDSAGRTVTAIKDLVRTSLPAFGDVDGVLGLKTAYQDKLLGNVLLFAEKYLVYFLIVIAIIVIIKFLRDSVDLIYAVGITILSVFIAFCFIKIFPIFLPMGYNFAVNNIGEKLYYDTLILKSEKYNDTYGKSGKTDKDGKLVMSTTSVNLYKLKDSDVEELAGRLHLSKEQLLSGKAYVIDESSGLFIEGNVLKQNVDKLFYTLPIQGKAKKIEGANVYQFKATKAVSNATDYYGPYYQIVDSFINQLNKFSEVYEVPRGTLQYADKFYKDSFIVSSFANSSVYLKPGDFTSDQEQLSSFNLQRLKESFPGSEDFLGLSSFLLSPSDEMKETLWYKTLEQNGYTQDSAKMDKLIANVNYQTRKFINDISDQMGYVSDENLIKVISLYAWCTFNQKASDYNNFIYPQTINYEELKLGDIMLPLFTTQYDRFVSQQMDIVNYITLQYNWFNLIAYELAACFSFLIINALSFIIPILYIAFAVLVFGRFIASSEVTPAIKGYFKVSALFFLYYTMYNIGLKLVGLCKGSVATIWLLLAISAFLLFLLIRTLFIIITNPTDLGNEKIDSVLNNLASKLHLDSVNDMLKVMTTSIVKRDSNYGYNTGDNSAYDVYRDDADIDTVFDDVYQLNGVARHTNSEPISYSEREAYIDYDNRGLKGKDKSDKYKSDLDNLNDYV